MNKSNTVQHQNMSKTRHQNGTKKKTRGATVTGCAPVISFCCKGLLIRMKTKSNAGGKMIRDMGK